MRVEGGEKNIKHFKRGASCKKFRNVWAREKCFTSAGIEPRSSNL
jgi:hypothetical protein